jgi:antitoxin component of MazEF toxin-antitoxin module
MRVKLVVRRVGNSLGIIIPRATLHAWGVDLGDSLELEERSIRPPGRKRPAHQVLDELKLKLAAAVAARFPANEIRARALANLHRWRASGMWVTAYDEWLKLLEDGHDGELYATMLGRDERSNRLRQSAPYVGLLPRDEVHRINEEASA